MKLQPLDRIMLHVDKGPDGHWIWTAQARSGANREYGLTTVRGRQMGAHRAVWILMKGPIPEGMDLLHNCRYALCVNPDHLRPGTPSENLMQAVAEHEPWWKMGEEASHAKLTWAAVRAIRRRAAAGERHRPLAAEFGVTGATISHIVTGRTWKDPR
jgi:hypothetical protein